MDSSSFLVEKSSTPRTALDDLLVELQHAGLASLGRIAFACLADDVVGHQPVDDAMTLT